MALTLIISAVCGVIAAVIASTKGRSAVGWFFGGFLLGIIGVIIVACLSNLQAERARQEQIDRENRRLREQLRQERLKSEAFRQHAALRLDAHDGALSMDTRSTPALPMPEAPAYFAQAAQAQALPVGGTPAPIQRQPAAASQEPSLTVWYYEREGKAVGPVPKAEIAKLLSAREINGETLVWTEALKDWTPARQVPAFRPMVGP